MPITRTNQPKPFLSFSAAIFLLNSPPTNIPATAIAVIERRKLQWILKCPKSPAKPNKEFIAMMIREVPTAFFIGNFTRKISAGINRKPPPAPSRPVTKPMLMPYPRSLKNLIQSEHSFSGSALPVSRIMLMEAINMSIPKRTIVRKDSVTVKVPIVIISLGIIGISNFRVAKTVTTEAAPKNKAAFKFTKPLRRLPTEPIKLVKPTINKE